MHLACRICENTEDNRVHKTREMMFGMRDQFDYVECGKCGTLQIRDVPDLAKYYPSEYYSFDVQEKLVIAQRLRRRLGARLIGSYFIKGRGIAGKFLAEKKQWLAREFPPSLREKVLGLHFDSRILDFGCGSGHLLRTLYYFGFKNLTGADLFVSSDIHYPENVHIFRRDLTDIEPGFDVVMLHHSFEHLTEPLKAIRKINEILAPGGICLVRMPVVNFAWEKYGPNWVQLDPPRHIFIFTEETFREIAENAGFHVVKVVYD